MTRDAVQKWLDAYVSAWKTYDPQQIRDLFSEDATYAYGPYDDPVRGCEAIVASWLEEPDAPGTYDAQYAPVAVDGSIAVANGRSRYFADDGTTLTGEFDNIFVLHFDETGRCTRFTEWYMSKL